RRSAEGGPRLARRVSARPAQGGLRRHHDRDPRRPRLLLRRGLPPAIPRQESLGLLRARRHRRPVPGRRRARRVARRDTMLRRSQITMSDAELEALLAEESVVTCATNAPSGQPHRMRLVYFDERTTVSSWTFSKSPN